MTISRDIAVAIFLLAVCGVLWYASFDIRVPDYGQLSPATWPRVIIGALTLLSFLYLVQSVRAGGNTAAPSLTDPSTETQSASNSDHDSEPTTNNSGFYNHWKNVIWCFVLFGLYLYSLEWLGMLVGALAFVFLLLCALGGWQPKKLLMHAVIAIATVGGMWSLFTYGLGVLLPSGSLF